MKSSLVKMLVVAIILCLFLACPVSAWGKSVNVATIDDYPYSNTGTCSSQMGCYSTSDYSDQTFTSLDTTGVSAATLAGKDTLVLWGYNPSLLSTSQKDDINAWLRAGGKIIIWDSEDAYYDGPGKTFDYSWMASPFSISAPGALGATGWPLWIKEENELSTYAAGPYQINNASLSASTDAVGDAAIFTAMNPQDWCVDMQATNVLKLSGPVHVYSKPIGSGIIIYSGLDWDYESSSGPGYELVKMLRNELNANTLPCAVVWTGNIKVTKVADKAVYAPGDMITFTVTVQNPADNPSSVYNAVLTDTPPAEVTLIDPAVYNLGTIPAGTTVTQVITATAVTEGYGLVNKAAVSGENANGQKVFSGSDDAIFDIVGTTPAPEFPSIALPVGMILGLVFIVFGLKRKDE